MIIACEQCRIEKEMRSQNFWYHAAGGRVIYLCDECRLHKATKKILEAIGEWCPDLFDIKKFLESLL